MKYHSTKPQTAVSFGNSNVPVVINTTPPPRKPHNLFSRNSLIFLFLIAAITLLSGCPDPTGPRGAQGPKGDKGDTGDTGAQGAPSVLRECHLNQGYPTACYNATSGVLTLTGIDLADVGGSGTDDDVDMEKISIAGKGGDSGALSLSAAPTIAKVDNSEFTLTLAVADRGSILEILDRNGTIASDRMLYSIALENNWNGSSSSAISMPVRTTNFPPGYCGNLTISDADMRTTVARGVANEFFGGGTGAMDAPLLITMRQYCSDLSFNWNIDYPAVSSEDTQFHKDITFTTTGTYSFTWTHLGPAGGSDGHFVHSPGLGITSPQGGFWFDPIGTTFGSTSMVPFGRLSPEQTAAASLPLVIEMEYSSEATAYVGALGLRIQRM